MCTRLCIICMYVCICLVGQPQWRTTCPKTAVKQSQACCIRHLPALTPLTLSVSLSPTLNHMPITQRAAAIKDSANMSGAISSKSANTTATTGSTNVHIHICTHFIVASGIGQRYQQRQRHDDFSFVVRAINLCWVCCCCCCLPFFLLWLLLLYVTHFLEIYIYVCMYSK